MKERGGPMSAKSFGTLFTRLGERAGMPFPVFPHMLRHVCGFALANAGRDTRALQAWHGHKNIQHTVRCTKLNLVIAPAARRYLPRSAAPMQFLTFLTLARGLSGS